MTFLKHNRQLDKREVTFIIVLLVLLAGAGFFAWYSGQTKEAAITNFEQCAAAGNPIMESYPEQCSANGKTYVNDAQTAPALPDKQNP